LRRADATRALEALERAGWQTDLTFPHWLGKAFFGEEFVDVIFSSGNGVAVGDDGWFEHAVAERGLGTPVPLCPAQGVVRSKAFIRAGEPYGGADIAPPLLAGARGLAWPRLLGRFGEHWRVLLSHLILFGFVYPSERDRVPAAVLRGLTGRLEREMQERPPS